MAQETFTAKEFSAELDKLGEEVVRQRFIGKAYGDVGPKHDLAEEWLRRKDQSRQNRPFWIAAWAAIVAVVVSVVALVVSLYRG